MDQDAVNTLSQHFDVIYDPDLVDQPKRLRELLPMAHALIVRNRTQVTRDLLDLAGQLTVVGRLGVGLDNIDVAACEARQVQVIPATGANAGAVAEYVIAASMVLLRGAFFSTPGVIAGQWPRPALSQGREISGKVMGLVGFGGIGQYVARLAQGLGMTVQAYDPWIADTHDVWSQTGVQSVSLDQLLANGDVISIHVPLTQDTQGLFNADVLGRMKPGAVLINTARGGIVDEAALAQALMSGHLGGAALDVFQDEPLTESSVFNAVPNLILTPHIGGVTQESNVRVSTMVAKKVAQSLAK